MSPRVVPGARGRRERRVGEGADRDHDQVGLVWLGVEDLRAAFRAEMEDVRLPVGLVRDARVVVEPARDLHLLRLEPGLHPEGAPGPALAVEAVADGDVERLALGFEAKLSAVAGGL